VGATMLENILLLILTAALLVYLVFALLRPEKF
jgi:K+-transporting ATPase KdpF subunit